MAENKQLLKRTIWTIFSIVINALGVSMVTITSLGTIPATSIPNVLGIAFNTTIGGFTFVVSVIQILLQIVILKKRFAPIQLLQIIPAVIISYFIDLFMGILKHVPFSNYSFKLMMLICGCIVLGYSIALEVYEDVIYLPLDGFNKAISIVTKKSFDTIKIIVDCSMVVIASTLSFALMGRLDGIREGTIISAILAGVSVRFFSKKFFS